MMRQLEEGLELLRNIRAALVLNAIDAEIDRHRGSPRYAGDDERAALVAKLHRAARRHRDRLLEASE